jgi:hypothetical protein
MKGDRDTMMTRKLYSILAVPLLAAVGRGETNPAAAQVFAPAGPLQQAPHGRGNAYAPEVLEIDGRLHLWFGGQGVDGHDRILWATSTDGDVWVQHGAAFDDPDANHCNDPTIVHTSNGYFLYYTRAAAGVTDAIALATSPDGRRWTLRGEVLRPGAADEWDALSVGRPTALIVDGLFHLWYDGRRDLPLDAPDASAPKSADSRRAVGHATSRDGFTWTKDVANPVLADDSGGVDVFQTPAGLGMVIESQAGVLAAASRDGREWKQLGLLIAKDDASEERYGHVTPFVLPTPDGSGATLYYGAAAAATWDQNEIRRRRLTDDQWRRLLETPESSAP